MRNYKKIILILLVLITLVSGISVFLYKFINDDTKLNITEKKFLTDNSSKVISINVINDTNVFGKEGKGVYFDFLESFKDTYDLNLDIVTISSGDETNNISLTKGKKTPKNAINFFTDHFVLVSKYHREIREESDIKGTVGYLKSDKKLILNKLTSIGLSVKEYDDKKSLSDALDNDEVNYISVQLKDCEDDILSNLFSISFHFSDIKVNYYLNQNKGDKTLLSIFTKYYKIWSKDNLEDSINKYEFDLFKDNLKITEKDLDTLERKNYVYGYIPNNPYDSYANKNYGGITKIYLEKFENFSGFKIKKEKYNTYKALTRAINKNKINIYANYYSMDTSFTKIDTNFPLEISILMKDDDERVVTSLESLKNLTVYAKENSSLAAYLASNEIKVNTFKEEKDLNRILKNNNIVVVDKYSYMFYKDKLKVKDVQSRLDYTTNYFYRINTNTDTTFNKLLTFYFNTLDKNECTYAGINDSNITIKKGKAIFKIIELSILFLILLAATLYALYKRSKKVHIKKRIKKNDKMKYIDLLTSLKNRNYLNENIKIWNRNTIYPQAVIIIDLSDIRKINDTLGYKEGDKQIQQAANILIRLQLDNSEIMRTDGNEFMIYLVGYDEKHILSYIKKLNKEFTNLPHDYPVFIGFSMIQNDVKLVSDAINEATIKMKENKELHEKENKKE